MTEKCGRRPTCSGWPSLRAVPLQTARARSATAPWQRHRTTAAPADRPAVPPRPQAPPPSTSDPAPRGRGAPVTDRSSISIAPNITQYFHEVISDAIRVRHVEATDAAATYLVALLCDYAHPDEKEG